MAELEVPTAGYRIAQAPDSLATTGIGSCLVICLYSAEHKIGALIHAMLPRGGQHITNSALYADTALSEVLEKLLHGGISPTSLTAKLVGGAEMFPALQSSGDTRSIGTRNTEETTRLLDTLRIPIAASSTGGNLGRNLVFNLNTGLVTVSTAFETTSENI